MSKSTNTVVHFDWKTVIYIYACGNVAHNLCNSNNTAPSIGIIRVTIYAANSKVSSPAHVLARLLTKRKKEVVLEFNNHSSTVCVQSNL